MPTDDVRGLPSFGPLVGQPAFEVARGVVMQWCACDAEQALTRMTEVVRHAPRSPECLVAGLLTRPDRVKLRTLFVPDPD